MSTSVVTHPHDDAGANGTVGAQHGGDLDAAEPPAPGRGRWSGPLWWAGLLLGYLALSAVWWHRLLPHLGGRALSAGQFDAGLFIWWLRWTPFAISHGLYPLQTGYLQAPFGVSGMWNTSVPVLGVLFWPVTAAFGPVVSFNLIVIAGPAVSSWTAAMWLTRHTGRIPAAVGALVFGFSPFVVAHSWGGHLNFIVLALVPVIVMLVEDVLWRSPRPLWPRAPLLGLVVALQLFIGSETLLLTAIASVGLATCLAVRFPRRALARWRVVAAATAVAVAVGFALCAFPLWRQFSPEFRINGAIAPVGFYTGVPAQFVHASPLLVSYDPLRLVYNNLDAVENGMFVGWALIGVLAVIVVTGARRTGTQIAAVFLLVAALCQLAPTTVLGLPVRSPLTVVEGYVPVLQDVVASRVALLMWGAVAYLLAVGVQSAWQALDRLRAARRGGTDDLPPRPRWVPVARTVPVLVVLAALVPLVPVPVDVHPLAETPRFFTTPAVDTIPQGATVMVAPMATVANNVAEQWQVASGMRFKLVGGYALRRSGPAGGPSYFPPQDALVELFGLDLRTQRATGGAVTAKLLADGREELADSGATFFLLGPSPRAYAEQHTRAVALLGREPDRTDSGVELWHLHR